MQKRFIIFIISVFVCTSSWAQESNVLNTASPKLRKFLAAQPTALNKLTNALAHTFANKTVCLFYFYSDDEAKPRAFHYYPDNIGLADVAICVRENQQPLDEFLTILFETINANAEGRFSKWVVDAKAGTISKKEFAQAILKIEFEAIKTTRDLLGELKVSKKAKGESYYYHRFLECPNDFDGFLAYSKKVAPKRDAMREYEMQYDALQKKQW